MIFEEEEEEKQYNVLKNIFVGEKSENKFFKVDERPENLNIGYFD